MLKGRSRGAGRSVATQTEPEPCRKPDLVNFKGHFEGDTSGMGQMRNDSPLICEWEVLKGMTTRNGMQPKALSKNLWWWTEEGRWRAHRRERTAAVEPSQERPDLQAQVWRGEGGMEMVGGWGGGSRSC